MNITQVSYYSMKQRCYNPKMRQFDDYGGRGIRVCDRWVNSYRNFLEDMGHRPDYTFSIDRIDGDGDYTPGNCRWATRTQQVRSRRLFKNSTTGHTGVLYDKRVDRYRPHIRVGGQRLYFGYYDNLEDAIKVRKMAKEVYFDNPAYM
jgi:hypothetical protein